jgi:hypothetical protein
MKLGLSIVLLLSRTGTRSAKTKAGAASSRCRLLFLSALDQNVTRTDPPYMRGSPERPEMKSTGLWRSVV